MRLALSILVLSALSAFGQWDVSFVGTLTAEKIVVPITYRGIGSNAVTTGAASYPTSAANNASANSLVLAMVMNSKATAADVVNTFTGMGLTWDKIAETNWNNGTIFHRMTIFRSMTNAETPSLTCTADFNGVNQTGNAIRVCEFSGVDTSGTRGSGAVVQIVMASTNATGTAVGVNLGTLDASGKNAVVMFAGNQVNGFNGTAENGWTEDWDTGYNTPASGQYEEYQLLATDNTPRVTAGTAAIWGAIALEVKIAP